MGVTLEPMGPGEWDAWQARSVQDYADAKVRAGVWAPGDALARARRDFEELLPDGLATVGHVLRSVVDGEGTVVGGVWLAAKGPEDPHGCYVWDIEIHPDMRGRGYGRDAMRSIERLAHELGYRRIELHVFADNTVARALYRSLGFVETDVAMRKDLG